MIYIVDDDKYVIRGFQILLKSAGLESTAYQSVEEFIKSWEYNSDDLLILDIHLSGLNGCYLLEYLKKNHLHLPVIVVTAYDEQESRNSSISYGTLAYLLKPVEGEALIELIKNNSKKLN